MEENILEGHSSLELSPVSVEVCSLEPIPSSPLDQVQEDEWEEWSREEDPWSSGDDPWGGIRACSPCAPNAYIPTVESIFKARAKCPYCDKAGVYDDLAERLKRETYLQPRRSPARSLKHSDKKDRRIKNYWAALSSHDNDDDTEELSHEPGKYCKTAMPECRPDGSPQQIWLASCIPAPPFEPPPSDLDALSLRWRVQEPCPTEPAYYDCDEWVDSDSSEEDLPFVPPVCSPLTDSAKRTEALELNSLEINTVNAQEYELVEMTVDSGAGEPVCNPDHFPGVTLVDSPGSIAGQKYVGPSGEEIPNEGQFSTSLLLEDSREGKFTFQAAPVRKPLLAVTSVNDKGNLVIFDGIQSFVIPGKGPLIAKLRALIKEIPGKVQLHRKNGVYNMKAWRPKAGFSRQGR